MGKLRALALGSIASVVFALVAVTLVRITPAPLRPADALLAGAAATFAALLVLFIGYMLSTRQRDIFFKKRPKQK